MVVVVFCLFVVVCQLMLIFLCSLMIGRGKPTNSIAAVSKLIEIIVLLCSFGWLVGWSFVFCLFFIIPFSLFQHFKCSVLSRFQRVTHFKLV